jgi:hypothetical protein
MTSIYNKSCNKQDNFFFLVGHICRNPSLGLATKVRACKIAGQKGTPGGTLHAPGSAKECEGMNPHTFK